MTQKPKNETAPKFREFELKKTGERRVGTKVYSEIYTADLYLEEGSQYDNEKEFPSFASSILLIEISALTAANERIAELTGTIQCPACGEEWNNDDYFERTGKPNITALNRRIAELEKALEKLERKRADESRKAYSKSCKLEETLTLLSDWPTVADSAIQPPPPDFDKAGMLEHREKIIKWMHETARAVLKGSGE